MALPTEVILKQLPKNVTISVVISSKFKVRAWIATKLIGLAVWILGARLEVEGCD